jgi:hypothetical protein
MAWKSENVCVWESKCLEAVDVCVGLEVSSMCVSLESAFTNLHFLRIKHLGELGTYKIIYFIDATTSFSNIYTPEGCTYM